MRGKLCLPRIDFYPKISILAECSFVCTSGEIHRYTARTTKVVPVDEYSHIVNMFCFSYARVAKLVDALP